jgi:predicted secreted protein
MVLRSFLATLVCAAALAACSATQATDTLGGSCDAFRTTKVLEQSTVIPVGVDVKVALCSNPSTGFSWGEPRFDDATVLRLVDRAYQAPGAASVPVVGAAGGEILTVRGLKAGSTLLSISYDQPWAGGTKGEWTYTLAVTVQ